MTDSANRCIHFARIQRVASAFAMVALLMSFTVVAATTAIAGPPSAADDIDFAASGFMLPPGVQPASWATAAGGTNYADPRMGAQNMMRPGMPLGGGMPMAGGMPMGPSMMGGGMPMGPGMGAPGMMGGQMMPPNQSMASSLPSAPLSPYGQPLAPNGMPVTPYGQMRNGLVSTGLQAPIGTAGYQQAMQAPYGTVMPVGFLSGSACDSCPSGMCGCEMGGCSDQACGCGEQACSGGCGGNFRGILPAVMGDCSHCGGRGCGSCVRSMLDCGCLGEGGLLGQLYGGGGNTGDLGLLASYLGGGLAQLAEALRPYADQGKCAQRWYDISAEALFLSQSIEGFDGDFVLANRGTSPNVGIANNPALTIGDSGADDLEVGMRLSLAMIFGAGSNLEATYMGGQDFGGSRTALRDGARLTSYLSGFGDVPNDGYNNTSDRQTVSSDVSFHSGELNYRRRTVGPYCRFQGSWLLGLRYLRYDNEFLYQTFGGNVLNQFFRQSYDIENSYIGPQVGGDFWWNMVPGVNLGVGLKGAWVQHEWERRSFLQAEDPPTLSAGPFNFDDGGHRGSFVTDLEATLVYRFARSWAFRTSYHLIVIDDVIAPTISRDHTLGLFNNTITTAAPTNRSTATLTGFTIGAEYLW